MRILYNDKITAVEAKRRLENARPNAEKNIWIENRKGELYLNLKGSRSSTIFKLSFTKEYMILTYSGICSFMNIAICVLGCCLFIIPTLIVLLLSLVTLSLRSESIVGMVLACLFCSGILWTFLLEYRIRARKYVYKIWDIKVKE